MPFQTQRGRKTDHQDQDMTPSSLSVYRTENISNEENSTNLLPLNSCITSLVKKYVGLDENLTWKNPCKLAMVPSLSLERRGSTDHYKAMLVYIFSNNIFIAFYILSEMVINNKSQIKNHDRILANTELP